MGLWLWLSWDPGPLTDGSDLLWDTVAMKKLVGPWERGDGSGSWVERLAEQRSPVGDVSLPLVAGSPNHRHRAGSPILDRTARAGS